MFKNPSGANASVWKLIGEALSGRDVSQVTVLQVPSHLDPEQILESPLPEWMFIGNPAADEFARWAASKARVSSAARSRIALIEKEAGLIRQRLLRSTL